VTLNLDRQAPVLTPTVTPAPNEAGWHATDPTIRFECTDALSGVASCPDPITVTDEGSAVDYTASAEDLAGDSAQATVTINLDKTPPQLGFTAPGHGGAVTQDPPPVTLSVSDNLALSLNGQPVAAECSLTDGTAQCQLPAPIPGTQATLQAQVSDLGRSGQPCFGSPRKREPERARL